MTGTTVSTPRSRPTSPLRPDHSPTRMAHVRPLTHADAHRDGWPPSAVLTAHPQEGPICWNCRATGAGLGRPEAGLLPTCSGQDGDRGTRSPAARGAWARDTLCPQPRSVTDVTRREQNCICKEPPRRCPEPAGGVLRSDRGAAGPTRRPHSHRPWVPSHQGPWHAVPRSCVLGSSHNPLRGHRTFTALEHRSTHLLEVYGILIHMGTQRRWDLASGVVATSTQAGFLQEGTRPFSLIRGPPQRWAMEA